jgi:hypothetical protein
MSVETLISFFKPLEGNFLVMMFMLLTCVALRELLLINFIIIAIRPCAFFVLAFCFCLTLLF